jgi:valyl-tRNA synthetase
MIPGTRDVNLDVLRVEGYRHFCNKIWNATKFALGNLGESYVPPPVLPARADLTVVDRWILSRLNACIAKCNQSFPAYPPPPPPPARSNRFRFCRRRSVLSLIYRVQVRL